MQYVMSFTVNFNLARDCSLVATMLVCKSLKSGMINSCTFVNQGLLTNYILIFERFLVLFLGLQLCKLCILLIIYLSCFESSLYRQEKQEDSEGSLQDDGGKELIGEDSNHAAHHHCWEHNCRKAVIDYNCIFLWVLVV